MSDAVTQRPVGLVSREFQDYSPTSSSVSSSLADASQKVAGLGATFAQQTAKATGTDSASIAELLQRAEALKSSAADLKVNTAPVKKAMHEEHENMMVSKIMGMTNFARKFFSMLGYAIATALTAGLFLAIDYAVNNATAVHNREAASSEPTSTVFVSGSQTDSMDGEDF